VLLQYEKSEAQTYQVEFAGRPHLMMSAEGWEEIAAGIEEWLEQVLAANTGKRSTMTPRETRADPSSRGDGEDQWLRRIERGPEPGGAKTLTVIVECAGLQAKPNFRHP